MLKLWTQEFKKKFSKQYLRKTLEMSRFSVWNVIVTTFSLLTSLEEEYIQIFDYIKIT